MNTVTNYTLNEFAVEVEHDTVAENVKVRLTDEGKQWTSLHDSSNYTQCTQDCGKIGGFSNFVAILKKPTEVKRVAEGEYAIELGQVGDIYFPLRISMYSVPEVVMTTAPVVAKEEEDFHMVDKPVEESVEKPVDVVESEVDVVESEVDVVESEVDVVESDVDVANRCEPFNPKTIVTPFLDHCPSILDIYAQPRGVLGSSVAILPPVLKPITADDEKCNANEERPLPSTNVVDSLWGKLFGEKSKPEDEKVVKEVCPIEPVAIIPTTICPILNSTIDVPAVEVVVTPTRGVDCSAIPVAKPTYIIEFGKKAKYFGFVDAITGVSGANYETCQTVLKPLTDKNAKFDVDFLAKHFTNEKGIIDLGVDLKTRTKEQDDVIKAINSIAFDLFTASLLEKK